MAKSLFVGNLSYSTTESALQEAFSVYGASAVRIIEGRGFGFVDVEDSQADAAVEAMNETEMDGRSASAATGRASSPWRPYPA